MSNFPTSLDSSDTQCDEIESHVLHYRPRLLTKEQRTTMLDDMRVAVLRAEPTTKELAGNWLSILCRFISQSAPTSGGRFADYFTDARLEAWVNGSLERGGARHTLRTSKGILSRILRAHQGLPVRISQNAPKSLSVTPLTKDQLAQIKEGCRREGLSALRGFVAAFCAGVIGDAGDGARFENANGELVLIMTDGTLMPVVHTEIELAQLQDTRVHDGDWREVLVVAKRCGIRIDARTALQTFRSLVLAANEPVAIQIPRFKISDRALTSMIPHLEPVRSYDSDAIASLRGLLEIQGTRPSISPVGLATSRKVASAAFDRSKHDHSRPENSGRGGHVMTQRISRSRAQRLAAEAREKAAAYPEISEKVKKYVQGYKPAVIDEELWSKVGPELRETMLRAGYRGDTQVRKMCTALNCYYSWRLGQGLPITREAALNDDAIDQFYLRGMPEHGDHTRNDYRSILHRLAIRVSPDAALSTPFSLGYNSVRPGYSSTEEAAIRRVCLTHRPGEVRRRLCALVGFSGGGGLDSQDFRWLRRRNVKVRDDGIHVFIEGPKARHVVIRRVYEPLVLAGIEGVVADDLIVHLSYNVANPAARVIATAQLFDDVPHIEVRLLRTTWITWAMTQRIPLNVLLEAAGLKSARTLVDMIALLPKVDETGFLRDGGAQ